MNRNYCILTIMLITIGLLSACSLNKSSQVGMPDSSPDEFEQLSIEDINYTNRTRLGMWVVKFNLDDLTATAFQIRNIESHYNVTLLLPQPEIQVTSYNPVSKTIEFDCTIHNALSLDWYDLRLIVYTADSDQELLNVDDWTEIYDIPVGGSINPFIAYAKDLPNRRFAKNSRLTENLLILLPEQDTEILITIDACAPRNCTEPYSIEGFSQDILVDYEDASAGIEVTVKDWQNDVDCVDLSCPEILGSQLGNFTQIKPEKWHLEIENVLGAKAGNYSLNIIAKSTNSGKIALHDIERITITKSEPITKPQVIYERTGFLRASDIAINGNYAYFAYKNKLRIVDISDLNNIQIVSELDMLYNIEYLCCSGDSIIIYLRGITHQKIIDVSDPYNPDIMGYSKCYLVGQPVIQGDYVYMPSKSHGMNGLVILDISDPNNPKKVAVYQNKARSSAHSVDIKNDLACVYFSGGEIHILDMQDPSDPQKIGYLWCPSSQIQFAGNHIYSFYRETVNVIDVTDPREPKKIAEISVTDRITGMKINGNYAFLDIWGRGMIILDITNPENPLVIYSMDSELNISDIEVIGDYAFLGCWGYGIVILDIQNPFAPEIIYEYNADFNTKCINYKDGMIFTYPGHSSLEEAEIQVWDVSIPENPLLVGSADMNRQKISSNDMDISGDNVCITNESEIIKLVDISDPANPEIISTFETAGIVYHLDLEDDFVYVGISSSGGGGLYIYNISDPTFPSLTGSVQFSTMLCDVCISGNLAYVTAFDLGMKIIDISDKANPYIIGSCASDFHSYNIEIADDYAIMSGGRRMDVINIQDPENPYIIASKDSKFINGCINGIEIHGNYAFLIVHSCTRQSTEGFFILDMTYPESPRIVDHIYGKYRDSVIHGNYAFLAAGIDGIKVLKLRE